MGSFHIWAIVDIAAINIGVHVPLWILCGDFSSSDEKMKIQAFAIMSEPDHNLSYLLGKFPALRLLFTVKFKVGPVWLHSLDKNSLPKDDNFRLTYNIMKN